MKNKSKVIVGLSALLAVAAGSAATGTYAWFTTNRTASISTTAMNIKSSNSNLQIMYRQITNGLITEPATGGTGIGSFDSSITMTGAVGAGGDISGDGVTFYKPTWQPGSTTIATDIPAVSNSSTNHYFTSFGIDVKNDASSSSTAKSISVYLNSGSTLTCTGGNETSQAKAIKSARVAIFEGTTATTAGLKCLWQQDETTGQYLTAATSTDTLAYSLPATAKNLAKLVDVSTTNLHKSATFGSLTSKPDSTKLGTESEIGAELLTEVAADATAHLTVAMWLEGTNTNCDDDIKTGHTLNLALNLVAFDND
jgi:hypothetical protein